MPEPGKVGGEELVASRLWVLFVCVSVSIYACAVAASPRGAPPPAPPPSLEGVGTKPSRPPPTLWANQSQLLFRSPRSCGDWLRPEEGLEFYLAIELP